MNKTMFLKYKNLLIGITLLIWMIFWTTTLLTDLLNESYVVDPDAPEIEYIAGDNIFKVFGKQGSLFFFTVQLNWIIPIFFLAKYLKLKWINMNVEFALSVWCLIMFATFWTIIAPFQTWEGRPFAFASDVIVHGVIPLFVVVNFLMAKEVSTANIKKLIFLSLTYPSLYYFFAFVVFYATGGVGMIYIFTNFNNPFLLGVTSVPLIILLNISTLLLSLVIISSFVLLIKYLENKTKITSKKLH